jgi:hypothetical protein
MTDGASTAISCMFVEKHSLYRSGTLSIVDNELCWQAKGLLGRIGGAHEYRLPLDDVHSIDQGNKGFFVVTGLLSDWRVKPSSPDQFCSLLKEAIGPRLEWSDAGAFPPTKTFKPAEVESGPIKSIKEWLCMIEMGEYQAVFASNDVSVAMIPTLTDVDLQSIGVKSLGHRKQILAAAAQQGAAPALDDELDDDDWDPPGKARPLVAKNEGLVALLAMGSLLGYTLAPLSEFSGTFTFALWTLFMLLVWLAAAVFQVCAKVLESFTTLAGWVFALFVSGIIAAILLEVTGEGMPDFERIRPDLLVGAFIAWGKRLGIYYAVAIPPATLVYWRTDVKSAVRASIIGTILFWIGWRVAFSQVESLVRSLPM